MFGSHFIKSWSSIQPSITMSSGEAEMVGVTKAAAAALGFRSLMADLGLDWPVRVWTDSTASIGMCSRQGLGKVRHLDVQTMWIQQRIRNHDLDLYKVLGDENPADLMTKAGIPQDRIKHLIQLMGCEFRGGRPETAPTLRTEGGTKAFAVHPDPVVTPRGLHQGSGVPACEKEMKVKLGKKSWPTVSEEEEDTMTPEELEVFAFQILGLPHNTWELVKSLRVSPPEARAEVVEPSDPMIEEGHSIGSAGGGREPLPCRAIPSRGPVPWVVDVRAVGGRKEVTGSSDPQHIPKTVE